MTEHEMKKSTMLLAAGAAGFAACAAVRKAKSAVQTPACDKRLCFNEDGRFTILQVADVQDSNVTRPLLPLTLRTAVEKLRPDLIVLTGDNIAGYSLRQKWRARAAIRKVMDQFALYGIPVAAVFGNHDDEDTRLTKEQQMEVYRSYDCFVGCSGVIATVTADRRSLTNVGTYRLPVYESAGSDKLLYNIWCFDSGTYNPDSSVGGYGYVFPRQVEWYVRTSEELKRQNGGEPVPSMAFQHIAPPQIFDALKEVPEGTPGAICGFGKYYVLPDGVDPRFNWLSEGPCPPHPSFAPGYAQLDAMVRQGDVKALLYGHDHVNAYVVPYKGIDLINSPGCTYQSYNDGNRGFRVVTLDKKDLSSYETYTVTVPELFAGSMTKRAALKGETLLDTALDGMEHTYNRIKDRFRK